ncbi:head maturation protease, ClpP-related [Endozoicomonas ascidiicola]|uniref:head maturation protease, ClpP-related n=1 Tax=Endozoicomonas ascidiicola TaxID=1698521 RepID=UPI000A469053|nr:head maturation protease, ClpP-related [Endozoicomonas ascidiicola]
MMSHNRQWFTFKNEAGKAPELFIYDDIDDWFGVSAQGVVDQIRNMDATDINVRINCRGGMVFEGIAIYNALRLHKANVHISIEGLAASIASVIAMAGDTVTIAENAMIMIHNPYGWAQGDADAMRKTADVMDKIADSIAVSYTARTVKTIEEIKALMDSETWYTATEALAAGLVDHVDTPIKAAARFDLSMFNNAPESYGCFEQAKEQTTPPKADVQTVEPQSQADPVAIADLCSQAGYPEKTAAFLKASFKEDEVKVRLANYDQIKNLCQTAQFPDKAADFIKDDCLIVDVQNALFELLTAEDEPINTALTPKQQGMKQTSVAIDTQAIYSRRNRA